MITNTCEQQQQQPLDKLVGSHQGSTHLSRLNFTILPSQWLLVSGGPRRPNCSFQVFQDLVFTGRMT